jgi:hypothetical protein
MLSEKTKEKAILNLMSSTQEVLDFMFVSRKRTSVRKILNLTRTPKRGFFPVIFELFAFSFHVRICVGKK